MERTNLLSELVELDSKLIEATHLAALAPGDGQFEQLIHNVRELRARRAEIQAKLDALAK
jgi:hypothetical protein